ncbi:hypothetical protein ABZ605_28040 [Streptomyces sp. NPDC012765]|uniref:hypothetical protein n=1 Tax=Streptomyces sp. NPDC012765 TaxID=3155249 RepID=UPI0033F26ED9
MTSEQDAGPPATGGAPQRVSLSDPKTRERLLDLIRKGHSISNAVALMGIRRETLYDWRKRDPEFAATLKATVDGAKDARKIVRDAKRSAEQASSPMWNYKRIAEESGLSADTLRFYNSAGHMPAPDDTSGVSPLWLPETITHWMANRPGKGFRSDLKDNDAG